MIKITEKWLKKFDACQDGIEWVKSQKTTDPIQLIKKGIATNDEIILDYCNWGICRVFACIERIKYAVYAAKQILHIFENEYPDDDRPRKAIKAAEKCIKKNTEENRFAASYAFYASASASAAAAASAAAYAYSAAAAYAYSAAAAAYAKTQMKIKILKYGIKLLKARSKL